MEIYIAKNKQQMGPYNIGQITQMLQSGILEKHDLYWHEGMLDWAPVAGIQKNEIKTSLNYPQHHLTRPSNTEGPITPGDEVKKILLAARICLGLSILIPLMLGVIGIIFTGPLALVAFILGIILLVKGRTLEGIMSIVLSIICPLLGWGIWAASLALYANLIHR